jgi:hypothetical protein
MLALSRRCWLLIAAASSLLWVSPATANEISAGEDGCEVTASSGSVSVDPWTGEWRFVPPSLHSDTSDCFDRLHVPI